MRSSWSISTYQTSRADETIFTVTFEFRASSFSTFIICCTSVPPDCQGLQGDGISGWHKFLKTTLRRTILLKYIINIAFKQSIISIISFYKAGKEKGLVRGAKKWNIEGKGREIKVIKESNNLKIFYKNIL